MAQIALMCPHCKTEKIGFAYRHFVLLRPGNNNDTRTFLQCEGCGEGVIIGFTGNSQTVAQWGNGQIPTPGAINIIYPRIEAAKAPADVPDQVRNAFLSGLDNLSRPSGANAAAIMFRRSIEIAVKIVDPKAPKGTNLKDRIDRLADDVATPAMKDWAHKIRLDANDATHEIEDYSLEDAKQLHEFAEMFLTYAFTLPATLKRANPTDPKPA